MLLWCAVCGAASLPATARVGQRSVAPPHSHLARFQQRGSGGDVLDAGAFDTSLDGAALDEAFGGTQGLRSTVAQAPSRSGREQQLERNTNPQPGNLGSAASVDSGHNLKAPSGLQSVAIDDAVVPRTPADGQSELLLQHSALTDSSKAGAATGDTLASMGGARAAVDASVAALEHNAALLAGLDLRHTPSLQLNEQNAANLQEHGAVDTAAVAPIPGGLSARTLELGVAAHDDNMVPNPRVAEATTDGQAQAHEVKQGTANAAETPQLLRQTASSLATLHKVFTYVEGEHVSKRTEPCPTSDRKSALTALLLATVFPPAVHFYYGYAILGSVQLVLYLLLLAPVVFSCGWYWNPMPKGLTQFPFHDTLGDTLEHINRQHRHLAGILCAACVLLMGLVAWQVALVVRVATNDFQPANGCPPLPI